MNYQVVEKFISINGEGQKCGELAIFIRLASCNLRCSYCDTMWANESDVSYTEMTSEEIYEYIKETGVKNITLTGGEPLLANSVKDLIEIIVNDKDLFLEIETNGSVLIKDYLIDVDNLSFTVDYKSPSSLMNDKMLYDNYKYLKMKDTVKFVVGSIEDLDKAKSVIKEYNLSEKTKVFISPIFGNIELEDIVEYMKVNLLNDVRLQVQLHKIIWDPSINGV